MALCWLGSAALVVRFAETLGPLDLGPAGQRSTVVLDREGRLLRPFATADGRWRLPPLSRVAQVSLSVQEGGAATVARPLVPTYDRGRDAVDIELP